MQVGEVTIGVTSLTSVLKGLGECIAAFQVKNPRVQIRLMDLRPNQMLQRLRDGTMDFAISSQQHTQRLNLDWEALSRMRGLVVCRKNNPLRHSHSLRQLQFANWISLDAIDDHSSQFQTGNRRGRPRQLSQSLFGHALSQMDCLLPHGDKSL
jgi:DNA-binding transcriptional LysR family regulator